MLKVAGLLDRVSRVLCIGAHSDDIEIGCGGMILALCERVPGLSLDWLVCTATGARAEEAERSAERFAGSAALSVRVEGFRERYFPYQPEIKEFFDELGRGPTPDLVLVPRVDDAHQDHRTVADLARNTFRDHLILHYEIPKYDGDLGRPNLYFPLSADHVREKVRLIMEGFPTQRHRPWFDQRTFEGIMRMRGIESHAASGFAEGFHCERIVLDGYAE